METMANLLGFCWARRKTLSLLDKIYKPHFGKKLARLASPICSKKISTKERIPGVEKCR